MEDKQSPSDRIDAILTSGEVSTHRRKRLFTSRDLRATTIGWEIAIPIFGGPLFGFVLDRRFETGVRWTFILLGLGVLAAVAAVIKYLKYEFYTMNKEMEADKANQKKRIWRDYDAE